MHDFLIVGGGVVGLSLAWQLARCGQRVLLVDGPQTRHAASWAGAGILPPPPPHALHDPLEQLRAFSHELHPQWSDELRRETGVDNELRRCGGLYLARDAAEAVSLRASMVQARLDGVQVDELDPADLARMEPALAEVARAGVRCIFRLPDEMQVRSPRNLQALTKACQARGVEIRQDAAVRDFALVEGRIDRALTDTQEIRASHYVLTAGAWSRRLMERLGYLLPIEPWRGQMILWKTPQPLLSQVVNEGYRYLVPRRDGHLLVGATVEDVGFDGRNTDDGVAELRDFAQQLAPELKRHDVVRAWAGLRPGGGDGRPYLGWVAGVDNLAVATGHYRSGLHLAPATAVLMTQLLLGETPHIDLSPFRLNR